MKTLKSMPEIKEPTGIIVRKDRMSWSVMIQRRFLWFQLRFGFTSQDSAKLLIKKQFIKLDGRPSVQPWLICKIRCQARKIFAIYERKRHRGHCRNIIYIWSAPSAITGAVWSCGVFSKLRYPFFSRVRSQTAAVCARQRPCNNRFVYVIRALSQLSGACKL